MSTPLVAERKRDAQAGRGGPDNSGDKTVTVAPVKKQMPFVREKKGFAAQKERITERPSAKKDEGKEGEGKKEGELPAGPVAASTAMPLEQAEVAEGEEKGVNVAEAFKEFVESWSAKKEQEDEQKKDDADGEGKEASGEEEPGIHNHEHDVYGWTEKTETEEHTKTGHGANLGDMASAKELFTTASIVKDLEERREHDKREGKSTLSSATAGAKGESKTAIESRKGTVRQKASAEAKGLAGAQAAAKTLVVADDVELTAAIAFLARAGAFGQAGAKYDVRQGRAALGAWAKTSGGAGVQVRGRAQASIDKNKLVPALVTFFECAVQAGVWGDIEAGIKASYGPAIVSIVKKASFFAGASLDTKAGGYMNATEIAFALQASAMAGAKGQASLTETIAIDGLGELEFSQGVLAFAGVQAKATASATIGITGIALKAKASAFAGAKASVFGTVAAKIRGREVIKLSGKVGVAVGAGAEVGGEFSFQHGKLVIGGDLAAALKVGSDFGGKFEVDFVALGVAIMQVVADQYNSEHLKIDPKGADFVRKPAANEKDDEERQKRGYEAVIDLFDDHAVKVMGKINKGTLKGTPCLNALDLQALVQKGASLHGLRNTNTEYDRGIELAAKDAFGELLKGDRPVGIDALRVMHVDALTVKDAEAEAAKYEKRASEQKIMQALQTDLENYAQKKTREDASEAHRVSIQGILDKHWKALAKAFPNGKAAPTAALLVKSTLGGFLLDKDGEIKFDVSAMGKINQFPRQRELTKSGQDQRNLAAEAATESKIHAVHDVMRGKLADYKARLTGPKNRAPSQEAVQKIVNSAAAELKGDLKGKKKDAVRTGLIDLVNNELKPLAQPTTFVGDTVTLKPITWDAIALGQEKDTKSAAKKATERGKQVAKLVEIVERRMARAKKEKNAVYLKYSVIHAIDEPLKKTALKLAALDGKKRPDDALDRELEAKLNAALNGLFTVTVTKGALDAKTWYSTPSDDVFNEQSRKGKAAISGGEENDNARRQLLADAVREPMHTYAAEIRKKIDAEVLKTGKGKPQPVERAKLQAIIEKGTKGIRADVETDLGDEAVSHAVALYFGIEGHPSTDRSRPLLKQFQVNKLKIQDSFRAADVAQIVAQKRSERTRDLAEEKTALELAKAFRAVPGRKRRGWITLKEANDALATVTLNGLTDESVENVIRIALNDVFPKKLKTVDVENRRLKTIAYRTSS